MTRALLVLVTASACARADKASSSPPVEPPRPAAVVDAGVPPERLASPDVSKARGCIVDLDAESACLARGTGFSYGPTPFIYCSGVAADTRALAQQNAVMQRTKRCSCVNQQAVAAQQERCSMVP